MSETEYIMDTVRSACSLAAIIKANGDLKGERELLDGVAKIQDRLMYLDERSRNERA